MAKFEIEKKLVSPSFKPVYCFGCEDSLDVGESIIEIRSGRNTSKFHTVCLKQYSALLQIYLESEESIAAPRQN